MSQVILDAVRDLIKHYAISVISTGDRALDAALNTLVLSVIIYVFSHLNSNIFTSIKLKSKYRKLTSYKRVYGTQYYEKKMKLMTQGEGFSKFISIDGSDILQMTIMNNLISQHHDRLTLNLSNGVKSYPGLCQLHYNTADIPYYESMSDIVLFVYGDDLIVLYKGNSHANYKLPKSYTLVASSDAIISEFITYMKSLAVVTHPAPIRSDMSQSTRTTYKIIDYKFECGDSSVSEVSVIYPNRCFATMVSKWKKPVISLLDRFTYNNSHDVDYASYNLGFMFNGAPGTGKTNFIKSIANYLGRDVLTIDMNRVKTTSMFLSIITYSIRKKLIIVLDEFDCIQGVCQSRDLECEQEVDVCAKLHQERHSLMTSMGAAENKAITDEISAITKKILEYKNRLTLGSILTVLDGIDEQRGRVIIACTNYIDRIDSALLRPGRFDLSIKLEKFDQSEMYEMINMMALAKFDVYIEEVEFLRYTPADVINRVQKFNPQTPEELVALFTHSK